MSTKRGEKHKILPNLMIVLEETGMVGGVLNSFQRLHVQKKKILFISLISHLAAILRRQIHSPDFNYCAVSSLTPRSLGVS